MTELAGTDDDQRWVLPVTSAHDGLEHLVTEDTMTLGTAGRYTGLCGRRVWAAVLACPAGPPCPDCLTVRDTSALDGRGNRHGRWTRLISWFTRHSARTRPHSTRFRPSRRRSLTAV
jgi:hypothetical protein